MSKMTIKAGLTLCVLVCAILGHGVFCAPVAVADNDGGDGGNERSGGVIVPGDAPWDRDAFAPGMGRWTTLGKGILQLQELARQFKIPSAIFDENEIMRRRQIHGFVDGLPSEADEAESFSDDFSQPHFESERNTEEPLHNAAELSRSPVIQSVSAEPAFPRNDVVEMDTAEEIIQTDSAPESLGVNLSPVRYEFAEQEQDDALETVAAEKMDLHYLYTHGLNTEPLVKGDDGDPVSRDLQINARLSSGQQQGYSAGNGPDKDSNYCWTRFLPQGPKAYGAIALVIALLFAHKYCQCKYPEDLRKPQPPGCEEKGPFLGAACCVFMYFYKIAHCLYSDFRGLVCQGCSATGDDATRALCEGDKNLD